MEYWESRFKEEGAMWKFEPSDSALIAMKLFKSAGINKILIPGCGYGRNARLFHENGFKVTGIEISQSAIDIAKANGISCPIHYGSVTSMPFDDEVYDGILCYALIHLLSRTERVSFLQACYNQLKEGGLMIFTVASKQMSMYGQGKYISTNRYEVADGLKVFFYDSEAVHNEFAKFGLIECTDIEEPVKFMEEQPALKLKFIKCRK